MRLTHYGSTGIVSDAEPIRKHLFKDAPWKIFGQSYGAYIVHRYVTQAPDSIISASAHGDAILPDPLRRFTNRIEAQQSVLNGYLSFYPDDASVIQVIDQKLQ